MAAFTRQDALKVLYQLNLADDNNFLYGFASKPLENEVLWNLLSNVPQLFNAFFEYPVLMIFTAKTLDVHAIGGRHKGETQRFMNQNISDFRIRTSPIQTNIEFQYHGKSLRFWFMADSTGRVAYVHENYQYLVAQRWYGLID